MNFMFGGLQAHFRVFFVLWFGFVSVVVVVRILGVCSCE
jgi:hypothetical protein